MTIENKSTDQWCRVLINSKLHLLVPVEDMYGLQTYIESHERVPWKIEVYVTKGVILLEYTTEELWSQVLGILDNTLTTRDH